MQPYLINCKCKCGNSRTGGNWLRVTAANHTKQKLLESKNSTFSSYKQPVPVAKFCKTVLFLLATSSDPRHYRIYFKFYDSRATYFLRPD